MRTRRVGWGTRRYAGATTKFPQGGDSWQTLTGRHRWRIAFGGMYQTEDDPAGSEMQDVPQLNFDELDAHAKLLPFRVPDKPARLRGAWMVAAICRHLVTPHTADELYTHMVSYFGGEDYLKRYWTDPRAAFDAALSRAVALPLL
jgi:hypothetical protein